MSNYNADIRIGVVGQSKLKTLQTDLNKVNASVAKLNKALVLKTRAQTIKLNTKGANAAIKQLEDRINKLGRTITVNVRTNEQKGNKGGSSTTVIGGGSPAAQAAIGRGLQNQIQATTQLEKLDQERAEAQAKLNDNLLRQNEALAQEAKLKDQIKRVTAGEKTNKAGGSFNRVASGMGLGNDTQAALKGLNKELRDTQSRYRGLQGVQDRYAKGVSATTRAVTENSKALALENKRLDDNRKRIERGAKARKQFAKGAFSGAGVAASSALNNVPLLGAAVSGGLVGGLTAGAPGAIGGALAGGGADAIAGLTAFGAQATKTATDVKKLELSLKLASGADFVENLRTIRESVDAFNTPIDTATKSFTKLYASAQGSGIPLQDLNTLFIGLSAANKAFAGDAEDLNGILRAFTQIISKGTVQSEELKGQVGERLPGAFAMAAKSLGMTTAELQKALEQGEVSSAKFVKAFGQYMTKFETDAKTIAESPQEAGARLQVAMRDLEVAVGGDLADLGADFQDFATLVVRELIPVAKDVIKAMKDMSAAAKALQEKLEPLIELGAPIAQAMAEAEVGLSDFIMEALKSLPVLGSLIRAMEIVGNLMSKKPTGMANLGAGYKDEEAAAFAAARRWQNRNNKDEDEDDPLTGGGSGSKGPDRAKLATDMLEDQRRRMELLYAETDLEKNLLQIEYRRLDALKDVKEIEASKQAQAIKNEEDIAKAESGKAIGEALAADALKILKAEKERKAALDEILIPLQEQERLLQARLNGNEKEVEMDLIIEDAKRRIKDIDVEALRNQLERINALETENELLAEQEQFWGSINRTIGDGLQRGIEGLIKGTESLNDVLSDVLGQLGSMFINAGISGLAGPGGLFGKQGLPGYRAEGGPISAGSPYIVGEEGPELVVPQSSGTVIPNDAFSAATAALSRGGGGAGIGPADDEAFSVASTAVQEKMSIMRQGQEQAINNPQPIDVRYQATVINNQTYVTAEQFQAGMSKTANQARAQTLKDLRNKPAARSRAGVS